MQSVPPSGSGDWPDDRALDQETLAEMLARLAKVAGEVYGWWPASERSLDAIEDEHERALGPRTEPRRWVGPDPEHALEEIRWQLIRDAAANHRRAAREMIAWWADLATVGTVAVATGRRLHPTRAAAGDPTIIMTLDEMRYVPHISRFDPDLNGLDWLEPVTAAMPFAEEWTVPAGPLGIVEACGAEDRRRWLWGQDWISHRVPALPNPGALGRLLRRHGVPAGTAALVNRAVTQVHDALDASRQALDLAVADERGVPVASNSDREALYDHADQLTDLLAQYAEVVTAVHAAIRRLS